MSKLNRLLIGALVLQVGLLVMIKLWPSGRKLVKPKAVLSFDASKVSAIEIVEGSAFDGKKARVRLAKQGGAWVVASGGGYPVEGKKAADLLGKLAAAKAGAPVATRDVHHRKLEVSAKRFTRKVTLEREGKKPLSFYLGSTPGLKKVHLRLDGDKSVYAAGPLSSWDVGGSASSWVDTNYFKLERKDILGFTLQNKKGNLNVTRRGEDWFAGEQKLDKAKVDSLVSTISFLTLREPIGKAVKPAHGLAAAQAVLSVKLRTASKAASKRPTSKKAADKKAASSQPASSQPASSQPASSQPTSGPSSQPAFTIARLRLGAKQGSAYFAKRDASPFVVTIDSSSASALVDKELKDLREDPKKKDGAGPGGKSAAPMKLGPGALKNLPPALRKKLAPMLQKK
jgi:hypothetical protein